jgi:hypothetical protein
LLLLGGMATAGVAFPVRQDPPSPDLTGSLGPLRERWREVTVEESRAGMRAAARHRATMAPAAGSLWPDLPFPSFSETPARLLTMARAYAMTGDARLATAVATGVDHYRRQVYTAGADADGNWWHWEIGVPTRLLDAAVLVGPHLTDRQRAALAGAVDHFVPERRLADYSGTSTGANRVDLCTVMLLRALIGPDPGKAALAAAALTPVFRYVSEGDGLYRDGSFIQHTTVPYQGGYGAVMLHGLATLFAVPRNRPGGSPTRTGGTSTTASSGRSRRSCTTAAAWTWSAAGASAGRRTATGSGDGGSPPRSCCSRRPPRRPSGPAGCPWSRAGPCGARTSRPAGSRRSSATAGSPWRASPWGTGCCR